MDIMRAIELGEFAAKMCIVMGFEVPPINFVEEWDTECYDAYIEAFHKEVKNQ